MRLPFVLLFGGLIASIHAALPWKPAACPITTPWANAVDPEHPLPEYPRPQLVREQWLNLNGLWEFQPAARDTLVTFGHSLPETILVPFPWESALSGKRMQIPSHRAIYRRTFTVPRAWSESRLRLNFEAVNWDATVYVNGHFAVQHRGGYDPFSCEITSFVTHEGPQELVVEVSAPANTRAIAVGKQSEERFSDPQRYTYSPSSGIWQTVWLEPLPAHAIDEIHVTPDVEGGQVEIEVNPDLPGEKLTVEVVVRRGTEIDSRTNGPVNAPFRVPVPHAHRWSPADPFLYDLDVRLLSNGKPIDRVASYFGMRSVGLRSVIENGRGPLQKIYLNGAFLFEIGPLDQGFWPDGLYTAPTDEALRWDVAQIKAWGFNMVRKHIKVEPRRWYYECDRAGLLVWQDMPSTFKPRTNEEKAQFEGELRRLITTHWNHPSIINWIVFNEHWGAYDVERLTRDVKALDPSRLVTANSGIDAGRPNLDYEVGDIRDNHHYRAPTNPWPSNHRATVNGEFGAIGYNVPGHLWDADGPWVHNTYAGREEATREYERFFADLNLFKRRDGLSAAVYTQWTDVENELNGLYTYDRKIEKLDRTRVTAANRALWSDTDAAASSPADAKNPTDGGAENTP